MPKQSKVSIKKAENHDAGNRPEIGVRIEETPEGQIICCMCGRKASTRGRYPAYYRSNSVLHKGNGGYVPICKLCVDDLWNAYCKALKKDIEATRRLCMKLDVYWDEASYIAIKKKKDATKVGFKIGDYFQNINQFQYRGKTFDATIEEEARMNRASVDFGEYNYEMDEIEITQDQVRIWGAGFDPLFYRELDQKYEYWTEDLDIEKMDKATETLIRQICMQEVILSRDAALGKSIDKTAKMIDSLLGSLNLKPVQKQKNTPEDAIDETTEKTPFGVWIRQIEDDRPIPEPEEQFKDVDGLKDYIQTWFVGGLSNMMRINNPFAEKFEEAMREYTVEKPEYEGYDDDSSLDDLFEKAEEEGRKAHMEVTSDGRERRETNSTAGKDK